MKNTKQPDPLSTARRVEYIAIIIRLAEWIWRGRPKELRAAAPELNLKPDLIRTR